jgi:hypothetical protein
MSGLARAGNGMRRAIPDMTVGDALQMAFIYAVRCNFTQADKEAAWNTWYSGPKLKQMLAKPMFLTGQRFVAAGLETRRKYLALWCVASPDAFTTPEYRSDWGFFEWAPHITDWSRDLYEMPPGSDPSALAVAPGEAMYLASFEELSEEAAETAMHKAAPRRPDVLWLKAVGLDKHSPRLGLRRLTNPSSRPEPVTDAEGFRETIFTPISECARAPAPQA